MECVPMDLLTLGPPGKAVLIAMIPPWACRRKAGYSSLMSC